jgi:TetR/AcrR family transcriptional regulator
MARPSVARRAPRKDPDEFQARARTVAVRLFARHGFEGTSVQQIADELGVSKQALLYHFDTKDRLRSAALEEMVAVWSKALPGVLAAVSRPDAPVEGGLMELVAFSRAEPAYARFLLHELLQPAAARHPILKDVASWLKVAADYLRGEQAQGRVDAGVDPEAWLINLGTLVLATLALSQDGVADQPSPERIVRELARIVSTSLRGPRGA